MTYEQIKQRFDELVAKQPTNIMAISNNGLQMACIGALAKASGGDENRKLITKALIGKTSSKDFTLNEWYALFRFVFPLDGSGNFIFKNEVTNKWEGRPELPAWCGAVLTHVVRQPGQLEMFEVSA